nr:unnamed protein product [Digitaria exilis]
MEVAVAGDEVPARWGTRSGPGASSGACNPDPALLSGPARAASWPLKNSWARRRNRDQVLVVEVGGAKRSGLRPASPEPARPGGPAGAEVEEGTLKKVRLRRISFDKAPMAALAGVASAERLVAAVAVAAGMTPAVWVQWRTKREIWIGGVFGLSSPWCSVYMANGQRWGTCLGRSD